MNIQPFQINVHDARRAYLEYREAFRQSYSEQDEVLARVYRQISLGKRVIALSEALTAAGLDANGYPKLGMARADWQTVMVEFARTWETRGQLRFTDPRKERNQRTRGQEAASVWIPHGTFPEKGNGQPLPASRQTLVPTIPPKYRPPHNLSGYHILFEVHQWTSTAVALDPALLKDLGGGMYAVLAVWDLTPLEAAVLGHLRGTGH